MYCGQCGKQSPDEYKFCAHCGNTLVPSTSESQRAMTPPPPPAPYLGAPNAPVQVGEPQTSGKAIASLVLGLFAFFIPAAIAAVILGHISRTNIRESAGRLKGAGIAMAGLVLGYLGVAMIPVLIVAAIAIPNLLKSRIAANEASAVGSIRTINVSEITYASAYPSYGYACNLATLASQGEASAEHAALIDNVLGSGSKHGYHFEVECRNGGREPSFYVVAKPITPGTTGIRVFCSDQTGVIRYESRSDVACSESSPPLQ